MENCITTTLSNSEIRELETRLFFFNMDKMKTCSHKFAFIRHYRSPSDFYWIIADSFLCYLLWIRFDILISFYFNFFCFSFIFYFLFFILYLFILFIFSGACFEELGPQRVAFLSFHFPSYHFGIGLVQTFTCKMDVIIMFRYNANHIIIYGMR